MIELNLDKPYVRLSEKMTSNNDLLYYETIGKIVYIDKKADLVVYKIIAWQSIISNNELIWAYNETNDDYNITYSKFINIVSEQYTEEEFCIKYFDVLLKK